MLDEADDGSEVSLDGLGRVVAELQVVEEALTQGSHGDILVREKEGDGTRMRGQEAWRK